MGDKVYPNPEYETKEIKDRELESAERQNRALVYVFSICT
jgi:hypothetical protein